MEDNKIFEALSLINSHNDIDNELNAAAQGIQDILRRKYVQKLYNAVNESRIEAQSHPSREVVLLKALKAYSGDTNCQKIDGIIDTFNFISTLNNINKSLNDVSIDSVKALSQDNSISASSVNITRLLLVLALFNRL